MIRDAVKGYVPSKVSGKDYQYFSYSEIIVFGPVVGKNY